jgi:hypothetical protein
MIHNLHQDIFYIPDPTLAFVGIPFRVATFSLFEFQAIAVAAVFAASGQQHDALLPSQEDMRAEYRARVHEKGLGKQFHTLMGVDVQYAADLMEWVNRGKDPENVKTTGYSKNWIEVQAGYIAKMKEFGTAHEAQSRL